MTLFDIPAELCMRKPVITALKSASLVEVDGILRANGISSVPVVDERNQAIGILSLTDLLSCGQVASRLDGRPFALSLPERTAGEVMRPGIITVQSTDPLPFAARRMVNAGVHRVYVTADHQLRGVLSTVEILGTMSRLDIARPIRDLMTSPVKTIGAWETLSVANERLKQSKVSGLVVVESAGWPVGVFSQRDALGAQGLAPEVTVGMVMGRGVLSLGPETPLSSAAAQMLASGFRRALVLRSNPSATTPPIDEAQPPDRLLGIISGIDFARAI